MAIADKVDENDANAPRKSRITIRNEEKILDAALEVIAEYGFHGATVDMIADRAGLSKPNLHYYYRTKNDLFKTVLTRTIEVWSTSLARLDPDGCPREELTAYINEKVDMSRKYPTASRVFANEILRGAPLLEDYLRTDLRKLVRAKAKVIQQWIDDGKLRPVDPVHLIFLIWAATQHYADFLPQVRAVLNVEKIQPNRFAKIKQSLCDIILTGVLAPESDEWE